MDVDLGRYPAREGAQTCSAAGTSSSTAPLAFVINLKRRPERLARFREQAVAAGMPAVEAFQAIDTAGDLFRDYERQVRPEAFRELVEAAESGVRRTHRSLSPGALGVALSHVAVAGEALRRIALLQRARDQRGNNSSGVLVFEDDAQVPPDFLERLAEWTCQLPTDWDLLLLGWWDRGGSSRVEAPQQHGSSTSQATALRRVRRFWMMHATSQRARPGSSCWRWASRRRAARRGRVALASSSSSLSSAGRQAAWSSMGSRRARACAKAATTDEGGDVSVPVKGGFDLAFIFPYWVRIARKPPIEVPPPGTRHY